jgi:hypothetical protein
VTGIERISLRGASDTTLTLDYDSVMAITGGAGGLLGEVAYDGFTYVVKNQLPVAGRPARRGDAGGACLGQPTPTLPYQGGGLRKAPLTRGEWGVKEKTWPRRWRTKAMVRPR